jgi:cob(I)alamin adenosyltransferase
MKIYTRKGDDGTTGLLGGVRVSKHHARIEAYGNVDELNSYLGLLRDLLSGSNHSEMILSIQDRLFTIGSHLALDPSHAGKMQLPQLAHTDVSALEQVMDQMDEKLPAMKNFVLPGGHVTVSHIHVARCICRRAERSIVFLHEQTPLESLIMEYMNRLSDYLFTLSRMVAMEFNAAESPWIPRQ